ITRVSTAVANRDQSRWPGPFVASSWPVTTANEEASLRCVSGMPAYAGTATAALTPGTCAFHLFVGSASRRAPQVFMMQSTDARHLHHSPLARQLHTARLGCVFTQ